MFIIIISNHFTRNTLNRCDFRILLLTFKDLTSGCIPEQGLPAPEVRHRYDRSTVQWSVAMSMSCPCRTCPWQFRIDALVISINHYWSLLQCELASQQRRSPWPFAKDTGAAQSSKATECDNVGNQRFAFHDSSCPLVNYYSYWKWTFVVELPINNGDSPYLC